MTLLRESHDLAGRVEVLRNGIVEAELVVTAGSVTADATASVRRRCSLSLTDPTGELTPDDARSLMAPFGTELRIYRGLVLSDGSEQVWPQGVFRFDEVRITRAEMSIDGYDRSERINANPWDEPYVVGQDNIADVIEAIILDRDPKATFGSWAVTTKITDPMLLEGDPWSEARELADSIGCDLYVDRMGRYALTQVPDPDTDPVVWHFVEGEDATLTDLTREFSARNADGRRVPSKVRIWADSSRLLEPLLAEAVDDDPWSATYYLGPYGTVTRNITSTVPLDDHQAQADAELRRAKGGTEVVDIACVPNPSLDVGQVVEVVEARTRTDARFIIDRLTLPLTHDGEQSMTSRRRRL